MNNHRPLQLAVISILDTALRSTVGEWSVQGFGMLRLYIRNIGRLHIWNDALRYPNVSMIHNHSWDLRSTIISGHLRNIRYGMNDWQFLSWAKPYHCQRLVTGYHTRQVDAIEGRWLIQMPTEHFHAGDVYHQKASVIHLTDADNGTITLMERHEDEEGQADVYWPHGTEWGTAKPRPATADEIRSTIALALPGLLVS